MERKSTPEKPQLYKQGHIDFSVLLVVSLLCAFGLVMVFSSSYYYAQHSSNTNYDGYFYLKRQVVYLVIGYAVMLLLTRINYRVIEKFSSIALLASLALLVLVLIPGIGVMRNGGRRWIEIAGISVQPSEIAKFGMMLYMCSFMVRRRADMHDLRKGLMPLLLIIGMVCGLVMLQPNMSMAVLMGLLGIFLLYLGNASLKHIAVILVFAAAAFLVLAVISPYRWERIISFTRDPFLDKQDTGYQLVQSYYALGSGGWFGKGLNNSYQKLLYMTYGESDFIFPILCEEFGFLGGIAVLLGYFWVFYRGMLVALRCRNRYGSMLAGGISIIFGLQVFVNIGVVTGLLPTTGQSLPFISAGGTSLLIFLTATGVLLNISRDTTVMQM